MAKYFEPEPQKQDTGLFDIDQSRNLLIGLAVCLFNATRPITKINIGWRAFTFVSACWGCLVGMCLIAVGENNAQTPLLPFYVYVYLAASLFQLRRTRRNRLAGRHVHSYYVGDVWWIPGCDNPTKLRREVFAMLMIGLGLIAFAPGISVLFIGSAMGQATIFEINQRARAMAADDAIDAIIDNQELMDEVRARRRFM